MKNLSYRRSSLLVAIFIIVIAAATSAAVWYYTQNKTDTSSDIPPTGTHTDSVAALKKYNLQVYEPTELPMGVTIKRRTVFLNHFPTFEPNEREHVSLQAMLAFRTVDNAYSIGESSVPLRNDEKTAIANTYSPSSTKPTCMMVDNVPTFRLCHWIDYDRIGVYEIIFTKNETSIRTRINTERDREVSIATFKAFVNSFTPVDGSAFTLHETRGTGG